MVVIAGSRPAQAAGCRPAGLILAAVDYWAKHAAGSPAVIAPDGGYTFGELRGQVRRLAGSLTQAGAGAEVPVGLCLGRSRLLVPALLATWRAGAVAVMTDDRHPPERLRWMMRDAGVRVVIGHRPPDAVPPGATVLPGAGDGAPGQACRGHKDHAARRARLGNAAYIIYTSGTTGWPKGVEITYAALGTFLSALAGLGLPPGGTGVNVVSPAFDGWLWCTLLYLLHGQAVAIVDHAEGTPLCERLTEIGPRTVCLTPSLLTACADGRLVTDMLVVAGEPCPPGLLDRFAAGCRVLNVYGPTEATIAATWADTSRGDDVATIGHPLPGYRAYVLDDGLNPVPDGAGGELYLAGLAIARGYLNQPALTAARFLPDPFGGEGSRMYRTGDLVRRRGDGALEYLGRGDGQVKIRGFRVELGELERTACRLPEVRSAVAFVLDGCDALGLAVVPLTAGAGADSLPARLRTHCAGLLPEHMNPAVVLVMSALPTMSTGKTDRDALALAAAAHAAVPAACAPPATDFERLVRDVWTGLLPQPVTDASVNFFDAGGHSLLAARAIAELRRKTGLRVSMRHLLADPTAGGLATALDRLAGGDSGGG